jgi:protein TonB
VERAADFEATRRRDFQRMLAWSLAIHVGAVAVSLYSPTTRVGSPPQVISVELVAAPPSAAPKAPKPKAARPIPPPPPKPKPKQVVLPKNPTASPSKPKPARPEPRREVVLEPKTREEKSLEDLLSDMREEQGETTPSPSPVRTAAVPSPAPSAGTGVMSPEEADWRRRAKLHVRQAWVVPPGFRTEVLQTHVTVKLDAAGNVVGTPRIDRRSGNPWYDEGVVRGIEKASPLPPPPEAGKWPFIFVPEDAY